MAEEVGGCGGQIEFDPELTGEDTHTVSSLCCINIYLTGPCRADNLQFAESRSYIWWDTEWRHICMSYSVSL